MLKSTYPMRRKTEPGDGNNSHVPAAEPENVDQKFKLGETSKANAAVSTSQRVLRSVAETTFVHFYLACGHLITISKSELEGALPGEMKCWACAVDK
ncbi:MAG: hypothetical protein WAM71_03075 [Candidatus Korobacteraceae bacterium]